MNISLTEEVRAAYQKLFSGCVLRPEHAPEVNKNVTDIRKNKNRYEAVAEKLGIPWYFVGVVHCMEASLNFNAHLHNGDPLNQRTVHVPANRPPNGNPPFTWEESATDALSMRNLDKVKDWSLPSLLYHLEGYNGYGYRSQDPPINSPYLWSYSENYASGKFVADGKYDPDAVSKQCGAAVILRQMVTEGVIRFDANGDAIPDATAGKVNTTAVGSN
jgi:lysozyme family protein